ncbi:MAG: tetratricopeptide repeat protein, partial [Hyphomicrobiaceae bacterium]
DPRFAPAYRLRGRAHSELGDFEKAAQDLSRAIAFDPTNVETYLARGRAYLEAGNVAAAIKDFAKVIELQPQSATAYRERGHAFVLLNAFEEAERDLARSLELAPRAGLTFAYRALMYKKLGEPALGSQEIQKAMKLAPKDPQVLWAKGEIEESLSEIEAAVQSFRSALSADPQLKPAEHGLARLGQPLPNQAVVLDELNFGPWRVVLDRQRFYASHRDIAGLNVPLETVDSGRPRILEWVEKGTDFGNAGLLRFSAGKAKTRQGNVDAEYIALVDTRKKRVLDLIPDRMGERKSKWTWIDGRVTVASVDGLTSQHILKERPKPVARVRRRRRDSWVDGDGVPAWVPWANNTDRPRRRKTRRRRRKPKTLFDLLLGN